jgi:hypothetical protein
MNLSDVFNDIKVSNNTIMGVNQYNYLGLTIDTNLNWSPHIKDLSSKLSPTVGVLKKARYFLNKNTLMLIYSASINSRFPYLLPIWGTAAASHFSSLVYIQNRVLKFINFRNALYPTVNLYSDKFLSISQFKVYESILTVYKIKTTY